MKFRNNKAQGLSLNAIIIMILILLVLLVVTSFFVSKFSSSSNQITSISNQYIPEYNAKIEKINTDKDETVINIKVESEGENLIIKNNIPKAVIPLLNDQNKDQLINSNGRTYSILKEDPLIAWEIDKTPIEFNYTINKKISEKNFEDFSIGVEEKSKLTSIVYLVYILITLILILVFKPIVVNKKKK